MTKSGMTKIIWTCLRAEHSPPPQIYMPTSDHEDEEVEELYEELEELMDKEKAMII